MKKGIAFVLFFLLLLGYAQALNGITDIKADSVDESTPLQITVKCRQAGIVSLEIYSEQDEITPVYSTNMACDATTNAGTLLPGIYKIKATLNAAQCSPCVFYKYVNIRPVVAFFIPETHLLLTLIVPLAILTFIRFSRHSLNVHKEC